MKYTVQEYQLKSGAKGLIVNVPGSPVMSSQFRFRAGARFVKDYAHKSETAHIMEHMAFGASDGFESAQAYDAAFTKNGAMHNAFTEDYAMTYVADCAAFEWQRILTLQKYAICEPHFVEGEFNSEMGNVRSELSGYLSQADWVLPLKLAQNLGYQTKTVQEGLDSMKNITVADIREHYKRTHTAQNMRFIVAGDFGGERLDELKSTLDTFELPAGQRLAIPYEELHSAAPIVVRRKDVPEIYMNISLNVPRALEQADQWTALLLNHILTGTLHSRIQGEARRRGLAYYVISQNDIGFYNSSWDFFTEVAESKLPSVVNVIVRELRRIADGNVDTEELADAKTYALGRYQMSMQTAGQIAMRLATRYFRDGMIENSEAVPVQINAVTADQLIALVREFLDANIWTLGLYGNTHKAVADDLYERFGKLF